MHKSNSISQTPKRTLETSPSENTITEQERIPKAPKMTEYADKKDIQEIKDLISLINANTLNFQQQLNQINNTLLLLTNQVAETKNEIINIQSRVQVLEDAKMNDKHSSEELIADLNAVRQVQIETQISVHNIPQNIELKQALDCFGAWSNMNLNEQNIKHSSIVNLKNKNTSILFLDFYDLSTKHKLMKHARLKQKDINKKYIPVLTDNIFKLDAANPARGLELHFRDAMTDFNRNIFNAARKEKTTFSGVWISQGYVMVRINDQKSIKVISMNHLSRLIHDNQKSR